MKCRKSERLMIRLLETPGNTPEWKPVQEHLADCPHCQDTWQMLLLSRQLLEQPVTNAELGPYFMPRLLARVREIRDEKELNWGLIWRYSSKLMTFSFLLLLLLVATLFYDFTGLPSESPVVVDGFMEPSFSDRSVNDLLLQADHPQRDQVLDALLSSGGQFKR
jgi:hypothetical protein